MRFDDDHDEQPATVARVMADFALALILILVMLVGSRSGAQAERRAVSRAAIAQPDGKKADLNLALTHTGKFLRLPSAAGNAAEPLDGAAIARQWMSSNTQAPALVVVQFPTNALASSLHQALLQLQAAFGTNSLNLQTIPDSPR